MIARAVMLASVSSSMTFCQAASLTADWGRAAAARGVALARRGRIPSASASMNGVCIPSSSMSPPEASAVTMRQRRSVSTVSPARPSSAASVSSSAASTATCRSASTEVQSALT